MVEGHVPAMEWKFESSRPHFEGCRSFCSLFLLGSGARITVLSIESIAPFASQVLLAVSQDGPKPAAKVLTALGQFKIAASYTTRRNLEVHSEQIVKSIQSLVD